MAGNDHFKIRGGVCGIRRGKLATKKTRYLIGDTLASNSNPIKIFFKICQIKMNIKS